MTWFLSPAEDTPQGATPLDGQIPTRREQRAAARRDLWWRRDSWGAEAGYRSDLEQEMIDALGGIKAAYPTDPEGIRQYMDPRTRGHYLAGRLGQLRAAGPIQAPADLPGTAEEFDALLLKRRKEDFDGNRAILDRGDSTSARVFGEIGASILEPASIATMPLGGSMANAGRFILAETALGVASDVPGVMREQQVAEDLQFTPSDPATELAMSAAGSGAFAGLIVGAGRGVGYIRGRRAAEVEARPEGRPGMDWEDDVDTAEVDLRSGQEPRPIGPYRPNPQIRAEDDPSVQNIIRLISKVEAPKGFNQVYSGTVLRPPRPITTMSINQVLAWQSASVQAGSKSSAAGAFQIIQDTLRGLRDEMGLSGDELFDAGMQQTMALQLMKRRGLEDWRAGRISTAEFMDNMAQEWAALPRATGPNAGRSHYDGDGLNGARVGLDDATAYFDGEHVPDVIPGGGGGGSAAARQWAQAQMQPLPRFDQITTPGGMSVDVGYRVADLSELRAASGDLQPRDRSRSASDEQIAGIARDLDPRRLMPSPEAQSGTPIVGPDGMVESGNGRVAALNRAATEHPDRYQAYVKALEDAGYEIPEGVTRPVLIAERMTDLDIEGRRRFVRESNTSSTGRMSATEQAGLDADYLTQHAFDGFKPGRGLNAPENTDFVRRVFAAMPQAERAALMTADGRLNIDGLRRLRQALFARAFGADDLLKMLAETEHPAVENMLRMLEDLAPDWAAFRAMVEAGQVRPEFDITDPLMDAVRTIAKARTENREGQSVIAALRDRLAQGDMFAARDRDMADAIVGAFYRGDRARPAEATAQILQRYIADAEAFGRADIGDLLGGDQALTPLATLRSAVEAQDARTPMPDRFATDALEGTPEARTDIRALDHIETAEGARSPALTRSTDAARRELAERSDPTASAFAVQPRRSAANFDEARSAAKEFQGRPLTNSASQMVAIAGRNSIDKMLSAKAVKKSTDASLHSTAVANLDDLYAAALPAWSKSDAAGDPNIRAIHRLFAPMDVNGRPAMVKITVKETASPKDRNVIYTVEAVELQEGASAAKWVAASADADGVDLTSTLSAEAVHNLAARFDDFNARTKASGERAQVIPDTPTDTDARHLRTSDEPDASAPSRIPDATGQTEDIPSAADFQGDEVRQAIAAARAALADNPDLTIRLGEGDDAQSFALADVLDSMDQDESLIVRMTSCSLKGTPK